VVSHISRKTSEMWGTLQLVFWKELEGESCGITLDLFVGRCLTERVVVSA